MIIEIISVGNELLSGITRNSNAHWLADQIAGVGGIVKRVTVIPDELVEISAVVQESLARKPDILVTTGGLGATYDDLTLEAVAIALDKQVVLDSRAVKLLQKSFRRHRFKNELSESQLKMAKIPEKSIPIANPVGSAPGVAEQIGKTKIFCLPGVPTEMKAMFERHILPLVKKGVGRFAAREINYNVRDVTEAMMAPMLTKIVKSHPREAIYIKTHPRGYYGKNTPRIRVQLISRGKNEKEVKERLRAIARIIEREVTMLGGRIS
jgi:molybdenum cofactor synthesis domain-containing protein